MKRVLLVFSKQDSELNTLIEDALEPLPDVDLYFARTQAHALRKIETDHPNLVIVGPSMALDAETAVVPDGGMRFCEAVRGRSDVPLVLVVPQVINPILQRMGKLQPPPACFYVAADLPAIVLRHLRSTRPPPTRLDVIINARDGVDWSYELHGVNFKFTSTGNLQLSNAVIDLYELMSPMLGVGDRWRDTFEKFGQNMINGFCDQNKQFHNDLLAGMREAGGISHTRVIFVVAQSHYNIALEAIFAPPDHAPEPWMIHAPLLRNISASTPLRPNLFDGPPTPLRVLILCADTCGLANNLGEGGRRVAFEKLPRVQAECENLHAFLARLPPPMGVTEVVRSGGETHGSLTEKGLVELLRERWDVVHFAGHSYYSAENGTRACLIIGEKDAPIAVDIHKFAKYLQHTRLLYLSSCRSSSAGFAVAAANQGIPAVVGFRWDVRDDYAELHARLFYRRLFREKTIDTAFWGARQAMYWYDESNNTWASSMLVMGR